MFNCEKFALWAPSQDILSIHNTVLLTSHMSSIWTWDPNDWLIEHKVEYLSFVQSDEFHKDSRINISYS